MASEVKTYSISKYLSAVKRLVSEQIPTIWVHGVISQVNERGRMVYLAMAEYAEGDVKPVATLPLFIFASDYTQISEKLSRLPAPFSLQPELKVNLLIQADFYVPQGKFQGRVLDIDPVYTLGELALTRQAILERLSREGLRERNGALPMPRLPLRVGLVTGVGTAAYQDFVTVLSQSGFAFSVVPCWARMQGAETENSILEALGRLRQDKELDVVCIVRGGGSRTDLNYFDSEALCRAVALYGVPVLTGIGHEIDRSLLDLVAWEARITPTDCAKFLVRRVEESWEQTQILGQEIAQRSRERLQRALQGLGQAYARLGRSLPRRIEREKERQERFRLVLAKGPMRTCQRAHELLRRDADGLAHGAHKILSYQSLKLDLQGAKIEANDPLRPLARGYALVSSRFGLSIRSVEGLEKGDSLQIRLADGTLLSRVEEVTRL